MALGGAIKLKGESEYRRALDLIKQNLREVSSEMKIVTSTYDKNDTSTEALSAKSDVLNKRLEEQKSKLKLVSDQYKLYQDAVKQSADEHIQLGEKLENAKIKSAFEANTFTVISPGILVCDLAGKELESKKTDDGRFALSVEKHFCNGCTCAKVPVYLERRAHVKEIFVR